MSDAPLYPRKEEQDGVTADDALVEEELATEPDPEAPGYVESTDAAADPSDPSVDEAYAVDDEPVEDPIEPVELVEPAPPVSARSDQPVVLLTNDEPEPAPEYVAPAGAATAVAPTIAAADNSRVVYVENPVPPRKKHNRLFGAVIALLSTAIFAALYLGISILLHAIGRVDDPVDAFISDFVANRIFFVPVIAFAVFSILLALIVNRGPWFVHVIGSIFVGVLVYASSIGTLLLLDNVIGLTPAEATIAMQRLFGTVYLLAAGVAAREVSMWVGLGIAARGRRVTARNHEARDAFDREQAERQAEHERAYAPAV